MLVAIINFLCQEIFSSSPCIFPIPSNSFLIRTAFFSSPVFRVRLFVCFVTFQCVCMKVIRSLILYMLNDFVHCLANLTSFAVPWLFFSCCCASVVVSQRNVSQSYCILRCFSSRCCYAAAFSNGETPPSEKLFPLPLPTPPMPCVHEWVKTWQTLNSKYNNSSLHHSKLNGMANGKLFSMHEWEKG